MFPVIDKRATGLNIRRIMDRKGISVKDVQEYLGLGSVQAVYQWLNGITIPSIDNLYGLSQLFQIPMDNLICGNRVWKTVACDRPVNDRVYMYYNCLKNINAA